MRRPKRRHQLQGSSKLPGVVAAQMPAAAAVDPHEGAKLRAKKHNRRSKPTSKELADLKSNQDPLVYAPHARVAAKYHNPATVSDLSVLDITDHMHISKLAFIGEPLPRGMARVWRLVKILTVLKFQKSLAWDGK
jgi:hypothetical protein